MSLVYNVLAVYHPACYCYLYTCFTVERDGMPLPDIGARIGTLIRVQYSTYSVGIFILPMYDIFHFYAEGLNAVPLLEDFVHADYLKAVPLTEDFMYAEEDLKAAPLAKECMWNGDDLI